MCPARFGLCALGSRLLFNGLLARLGGPRYRRRVRIAVLDDYADTFRALPAAARLAAHEVVVFRETERDLSRNVERLRGFDGLLLTQQRSALPAALIEALPALRWVVQTGRSTSHLDLDALRARGVALHLAGGGSSSAPAELTWALILASRRHLVAEAQRLQRGQWLGSVGEGLAGRTLGLWGLGKIGARVARVGAALDMRVVVWGREGSQARAREAGYAVAADRAALFAAADVLTVHLPLSVETAGLITAEDLDRMQPGALFVNTSRAGLVAPGALAAALTRGRPGFAAVDVYDDEPLQAGAEPLLALPQVLGTPHLGYVERSTLASYYDAAVDVILGFEG